MTPGTLRRMSSTPQKQPPASTATSVCFPVATAERVVPSCSFMTDSPLRIRKITQAAIQQFRAAEAEGLCGRLEDRSERAGKSRKHVFAVQSIGFGE